MSNQFRLVVNQARPDTEVVVIDDGEYFLPSELISSLARLRGSSIMSGVQNNNPQVDEEKVLLCVIE